MFVYGVRDAALPGMVHLNQWDICILPDQTRPTSLRSWTSNLSESFQYYLNQLVHRADSAWEVEWLEQPYLTDEEAEYVAGYDARWYYVPDCGKEL